tara:strand:- start:64 stop:918 length:855 start_codon:yes stop_codon:yes gene_type:complete
MDFATAIKICFMKYADFKSRASRAEFWNFSLFLVILYICADIADVAIAGVSWLEHDGFGPVYLIITIATLLPALAVSVRRLNDINISGWWVLLSFTIIGLIPLIYLYIKESYDSEITHPSKSFRWTKYFFIPIISVFLLLAACYAILLETGQIPDSEVVSGDDLNEKVRAKLINNNIIGKTDEISYIYSEAIWSYLEAGQILTQDRVISYEKDEDGILEVWDMKYANIESIELLEPGSSINDSVYKLIGNSQANYEYISFVLSTYEGGDITFIEEIKRNMSNFN